MQPGEAPLKKERSLDGTQITRSCPSQNKLGNMFISSSLQSCSFNPPFASASLASLFTSSPPLPTKEPSVHLLLIIFETLERWGSLLGRGATTIRGGPQICGHIQRCKTSRTRHSSRNTSNTSSYFKPTNQGRPRPAQNLFL